MSTHLYYHCDSHDPFIRSEEVGGHTGHLPAVRSDLVNRDEVVQNMTTMLELNDFYPEFSDSYRAARWWFLFKHPHCDISVWDEYNREYPLNEGPKEKPLEMSTVIGTIEKITETRNGMQVTFHTLTPEGRRVLRQMGELDGSSIFGEQQ